MKKFKNKKLWKNIGIGVLTGALCLGAVAGLGALAKQSEEDTKVIKPKYEIGALTENGRYLETEENIYTKDSFECLGLDIDLTFDNNISYRVFFYDTENKFLTATNKLTEDYDENTTPMFARYARIVITPNDDDKISWYEINKYSSQLEISVDKQQKWIYSENLFAIDNAMHGNYWYGLSSNTTFTPVDAEYDTYSSAFIDCTEYSRLLVGIVDNGSTDSHYELLYFGTDNSNEKLSYIKVNCSSSSNVDDVVYQEIIIPQGATRFTINYDAKTINGTFVYGIK